MAADVKEPDARAVSAVDRLVGVRIAALRKARGMSQTALGQAIGVTFQQVQKYEKGRNGVAVSRLHDVAQVLGVPVSFFFDEPGEEPSQVPQAIPLLRTPGALDLLIAFAEIEDRRVRRDVLALTRTLGRAGPDGARDADRE